MRKNSFSDYRGRNPRFGKLVAIDKTKQLQRGDVTVVEVTVRFESYLFPDGFRSRPRRFIGRSRCSGADLYDAAMGRDIAEHKAMAKAYGYVYSTFKDNALGFARVAEACHRIAGKAQRKKNKQIWCFMRKGGVGT